jgi:glycosyltransferase involved in cell wall biosynthesis
MPIVSVITPVQRLRGALLREAGDSLHLQATPDGWTVEWLVQEDGDEPSLADLAAEFPLARYAANGAQLGVAATRNFALTRARGEYVHLLDSDDMLLPGALATMIDIIDRHPDVHWVSAQADDLMPDGSRVSYELEIPAGSTPVGTVSAFWRQRGELPLLNPSLLIRTATVRALGGWVGLPIGEDTSFFLALSELVPGYVTETVTWLYRKHGGNMSKLPEFETHIPICTLSATQRLEAARELGMSLGLVSRPVP